MKIKICLVLLIVLCFFITSVFSATLRFSEDFDDEDVDSPFTARVYGFWDIVPPKCSYPEGRGGTGYCYSSGDDHDVFVAYERGSINESWPYPEEVYLSWYIKYPSWVDDEDGHWNAKFFYCQEKENNGAWEMVHSRPETGVFFSQIRGDGAVVQDNTWSTTTNAWDGNWHRYEIYIHRTQGIYKFWYDGTLLIDKTLGQIMSTSEYDFSFGSIDAETVNVFTRSIDDIEMWDGMPPGGGVAGTISSGGCTESQIVTGGRTIVVTIVGTTLVETFGADNEITSAFIQGFDSAQSEATGWNAEVRDKMTHAAVTRTDANTATVILPATAGYEITSAETITLTIPATSTVAAEEIVATPTFVISAEYVGAESISAVYSASGPSMTYSAGGITITAP